jgi:hypothetical protein
MIRPKIAYSQRATRKSTASENHAVQNTSERISHHLPYAAKDDEASETRELYAARNHKASEIPDVYEARGKEASEEKLCMKPTKREASERKRTLKVVYKRLETGEKKKDEARSEEASESDQQQECI